MNMNDVSDWHLVSTEREQNLIYVSLSEWLTDDLGKS